MINPNQSRSVLDTIRSVQETIERIAKQTGTEHLFGNVGYVLGLSEKAKDKAKEEAKKATPANEFQVVDVPNSVSVPTGKSVQETINEILAAVNKVAKDSGTEYLLNNIETVLGNVVSGKNENKESTSDKSPIFGIGGTIIELGNLSKKVNVLSISNIIEIDFTGEEILDRCHWCYGEGGGYFLDYFAHAINNLKKHGTWGPANKPFLSEDALKKASWKDDRNSYSNNTIKSGNETYRNFNSIRNDKSKFNLFKFASESLKANLNAILGYSNDPTNGAYQWIGGSGKISIVDANPKKYNAIDIVTVTSDTPYSLFHSFYKFEKE